MSALTLKTLKDRLSKKPVGNLYFVMGEETYLTREVLKEIKSRCLKPDSEELNLHVFKAAEDPPARVRETMETLPIFSEKRLILYESAERLNEKDWNILKPVIQAPPSTSVLVFVSSSPDKRKKVIKNLMSSTEVVRTDRPKEREWMAWMEWMGRSRGLQFSEAALTLLRQHAGYDLFNLKQEVDKLYRAFGKGHKVSQEDVLKVVPRTRPENIFALSKAIASQKLSEALVCLVRLLEDNQNEMGVLALILRHIRILIRVKEGVKKGYTERTLAQKTGLPVFFVRDYILEADRWSEKKLLSTMQTLYSTDKALKSHPFPASLWLENLILKTCSL